MVFPVKSFFVFCVTKVFWVIRFTGFSRPFARLVTTAITHNCTTAAAVKESSYNLTFLVWYILVSLILVKVEIMLPEMIWFLIGLKQINIKVLEKIIVLLSFFLSTDVAQNLKFQYILAWKNSFFTFVILQPVVTIVYYTGGCFWCQ